MHRGTKRIRPSIIKCIACESTNFHPYADGDPSNPRYYLECDDCKKQRDLTPVEVATFQFKCDNPACGAVHHLLDMKQRER